MKFPPDKPSERPTSTVDRKSCEWSQRGMLPQFAFNAKAFEVLARGTSCDSYLAHLTHLTHQCIFHMLIVRDIFYCSLRKCIVFLPRHVDGGRSAYVAWRDSQLAGHVYRVLAAERTLSQSRSWSQYTRQLILRVFNRDCLHKHAISLQFSFLVDRGHLPEQQRPVA